MLNVEEGPAYGAAILAMVGAKEYLSINDAVDVIVNKKETIFPKNDVVEKYGKKYLKFKQLYPALKNIF